MSATLSKYERSRIIADRAEMISRGATPHVSGLEDVADPLIKARIEFEAGKCPLYYKRYLADHTDEDPKFEIIRVADATR